MLGSVISRNTCQPRAPRLTAATSSSAPIASMSGISSRATTGKVTKAVARTRPGRANTILRSWARSHGPKVPCRPRNAMTASAARMRAASTAGGSSCARRWGTARGSAMVSLAPACEEIDEEERDEGDREQDDGDGRRLSVGELLEARHDQHRGDLGPERHVAGDEDHRAVLAER